MLNKRPERRGDLTVSLFEATRMIPLRIARALLTTGGAVAALHLPFTAVSQADSHRTATGGEARIRETAGACGFEGWSEPAVLNGLRPGALPRTPALAAGVRQTFVVGQDWTLPDGGPLPPNPLIALGLTGSIGVPRGRFTFYSPNRIIRRAEQAPRDVVLFSAAADSAALSDAVSELLLLRQVQGDTVTSTEGMMRVRGAGGGRAGSRPIPWAGRVMRDLANARREEVAGIGVLRTVQIWLPPQRRRATP